MIPSSFVRKMSNIVHIFHNTVLMSKHIPPAGFPERPTRLVGVDMALTDLMAHCESHLVSTPAPLSILAAEYGAEEVARWERMCANTGGHSIMDDTCGDIYWSAGSLAAVRIAVAAACDAVSTVLDAAESGRVEHAYAVIRPPGHHCFNLPAGFCVANNLALAARLALARGNRVAIVDWDYHFGDGTAETFLSTSSVAFCSLHCESDRHGRRTYPSSRWKGDRLLERTRGRMFNIQWTRDDADNGAYISAFDRAVIPAFAKFAPDLVLVSAGYDALKGDALAGMELTPSVFYELTAKLKALGVPVVCVLEGGYDPGLLGRGVAATVDALLTADGSEALIGGSAAPKHAAVIDTVVESLKSYGAI